MATEFVRWLKGAAAARGIKSLRELARGVGMSHTTLLAIWDGTSEPRMETVHKFAAFFRVDPIFLLDKLGKGRYPGTGAPVSNATLIPDATGILMVPVIDQEAGAGGQGVVVDYAYIPPGMVPAGHRVTAVRVRGDCMAPRIDHGDVVIVDRDAKWQNGRTVLAEVEGELLIKRFYREQDRIRLHADAPGYRDIYVTEASIVGLVIQISKPDIALP